MRFHLKYLFLFRLILNRCKKTHLRTLRPFQFLTALWHAKRKSVARNTRRKAIIVRNVQSCSVRFSLIIFLTFLSFHSNAQSIEVSGGFNRLDYQLGVAYGHRWHDIHLTSKFEMGVTSSVAQGRFFPRVSVGTSYLFLKQGLLDFGPEFVYAISRQRISSSSNTAHLWNELYVGYRLQIGRTIKFVHTLNGGWINQSFYSEVVNRRVNYNSLGLYAQIGVSYTF